jgi:hypothetical protein
MEHLNREQRDALYELALTADDLADAAHRLAREDLDPVLIPDLLHELHLALGDLNRTYRQVKRLAG